KPTGDKGMSAPLPGAPGGANMKIGTPSAGGTVGTKIGPRLPSTPPPPYPPEARRRQWEGDPIVFASVSADGYVLDAKLRQSCGYTILDTGAIEWVKPLRSPPAGANTAPVPSTVHQWVMFHFR